MTNYTSFDPSNGHPSYQIDPPSYHTDPPVYSPNSDSIIAASIKRDSKILDNATEENEGIIERFQSKLSNSYSENKKTLKISILVLLLILYFVFFGFAIAHNFQKALPLVIITIIIVVGVIYFKLIKKYFAKPYEIYVNKPFWEKADYIWQIRYVRW